MKLRKFVMAVGADWLARMSGPLTVPFTIAALFVSSSAYRNLFGVLAVIAAIVTSYRVWAKEYERADASAQTLNEMENARPRIKLKEPGAIYSESITQTFSGANGTIIKQRIDTFLKVRFINDPILAVPSSKANNVTASIEYRRYSDDKVTHTLDGRWLRAHNRLQYRRESKFQLLAASFSQGQQRSLDIAFCDGESGRYYAWNNDNYNATNEFYVYPKHELEGKRFRITIRLRGDFVDETFAFVFRVDRKTKGFIIEPA